MNVSTARGGKGKGYQGERAKRTVNDENIENVTGATKLSDEHSVGPQRAQRPPFAMRNQRLTDGWNYKKVVVGSNLHSQVRMKSGHSFWARYREGDKVIDLDGLFSDYWNSNNREFTAPSQSLSPTSPHRSD